DGLRKEPMTASIPTERRASRGKLLFSGEVSNLAPGRAVSYETKLGRLGLLSFQHSHHNQHSDEPVRNDRLCSRPCSRTLPLGFPQKRHRQLDQRFQRRAGLGTSSHPWALLRRLVSSGQKKHKRPEALGFSSIQFPDTLKQSLGPSKDSTADPRRARRQLACPVPLAGSGVGPGFGCDSLGGTGSTVGHAAQAASARRISAKFGHADGAGRSTNWPV